MLTREEWQENPLIFIDSVMEAEMVLGDQNELIKLMGEIIYRQHKLIKAACYETGMPRVFVDDVGVWWSYGFVCTTFGALRDDLMPLLPKDWTETLEV